MRDLNRVYRDNPALHVKDCMGDGFEWIDGGDAENVTLSFLRRGGADDPAIAVICNFTPVERSDFRVGLPASGRWAEILNTDASVYGGGDRGNMGAVEAEDVAAHGHPTSLVLTLPPLSTLMLSPK